MNMRPFLSIIACRAALATSALLSTAAHAEVRTDTQPDLLFVLWDTVAKVSYTLDLDTNANNFWGYAQQDAGYSLPPLTIPATDPRFVAFRAASTSVTNQRWAVLGVQGNVDSLTSGSNKLYSTLRQGPDGGITNPNWLDMTSISSTNFLDVTKRAPTRWFRDLNSFGGSDTAAMNTHATSSKGSAFHSLGSSRYFGQNSTFSDKLNPGSEGGYFGGLFDVTNAVNQSSWFYSLTNSANDGDPIVVDEFDNLSSNGYWGLALTSSNTYLLSFTQAAAKSGATSATTEAGMLRVSSTDYASQAGDARLLSYSDAVTAVPEPSTWALFGLGLLSVVARARSRR